MVVALGPGKFYGSSLPRPRIYADVKLSEERIDPPLPVMDPLIMWAQHAHWSMGGLSFTRFRLQGRIEGSVNKLRVQREELFKKSQRRQKAIKSWTAYVTDEGRALSPPPAPRVTTWSRVVGLDDAVEEEEKRGMKRGAARKLGDDFERVSKENGKDGKMAITSELVGTRSGRMRNENEVKVNKGEKKLVKGGREVRAAVTATDSGIRSSPRLRKNRGSG